MKRAIIAIPLIFIIAGCSGSQVLTRRYKSMKWDPAPPSVLIDLEAIPLAPPSAPPAKPAILSLSDRGQASYIDAVKNSDDILQVIAKPFPKKKSNGIVDRTVIKKTILFSVKKKDGLLIQADDRITEADRISKLYLKLNTDKNQWYRLHSWDKLETVYGKIDLGKVTRESSGSFNAKLSPTFSGSLVGVGEIGGGTSSSLTEELSLEARHIAISGTLTPSKGVIIQQGGLGRDLEGNVSVVLTVKLDGKKVNLFEPGQLFDNKGTFKKPSDISLKMVQTYIPTYYKDKSVELKASADYILRHVTKGEESTIEGNHDVTLYKGETAEQSIPLLYGAAYFKLSNYYLIQDNQKIPVHIDSNTERYNLAFADDDTWVDFKHWLLSLDESDYPIKIGTGVNTWELMYNGNELKKEDVQKLGAYPVIKEI